MMMWLDPKPDGDRSQEVPHDFGIACDRSVLFSVPSLHLDDPKQAEALSSTLVRLAGEHMMSPRRLIRRLIVPMFDLNIDVRSPFMRVDAHTMDGFGRYAETMAHALGELSGTRGLQGATLLGLRSLLPSHGQPLLRKHRCWCSQCWLADDQQQQARYGRLTWRLELLRNCPEHRCLLTDRCPACRSLQPAIPSLGALDRCEACGSTLVEPAFAPSEAGCDATIGFVTDLIGLRLQLPARPIRGLLSKLRALMREAQMNRAVWCRAIGLQPHALSGWFNKGEHPSARLLHHLALALNLRLPDLLGLTPVPRRTSRPIVQARKTRAFHGNVIRNAVRQALEGALRSEHPPSLSNIARQYGVSRGYLSYWHLAAVRRLVKHRANLRQSRSETEQKRRLEVLAEVITSIRQHSPTQRPGRRRIERALLAKRVSLQQAPVRAAYLRMIKTTEPVTLERNSLGSTSRRRQP